MKPCAISTTIPSLQKLTALLMRTDEFDYVLPERLIAQHPPEQRGTSRLLHAHDGVLTDTHFADLLRLTRPNDVLVLNDTRVIKARLFGNKTSGKIMVDGYDLDTSPNSIKKIIGVQLQTSGFYPGLNLVQLIDLFGGLYNKKIDALALLDMVQLRDKAKAKVKELSGGQKQRFSIATTLINDPKIIFLDEPTTGLDPQARRNLWELISEIRAKGTTVIITTHYMDEAEFLCDRVAIMDSGNIVALNSPDGLIDELVATGFEKPKEVKQANLEDVFITMTGKSLRED